MKLMLQMWLYKKKKKKKQDAVLIYVTDILYSYLVYMPFLNL